jgi:hypothetical protein
MQFLIIIMLLIETTYASKSPLSLNRLLILSGQKKLILKNKKNESLGDTNINESDSTYNFLKANSNILFFEVTQLQKIVELSRLGHKITFVHSDPTVRQEAQNLAVEFGEEINIYQELNDKVYDALFLTKKLGASTTNSLLKRLRKSGVLYYESFVDSKNTTSFKSQEMLKRFSAFKVIKYEEPSSDSEDYALFIGIK